jgi:hypothetical protein
MTTLERARRYLACCDPAITGAGGHNTTFRVACTLLHGFYLSPTEALRLLKIYNEKCQPPWSDAELRHKILSAAGASSNRGHGYFLSENALSNDSIFPVLAGPPMPKWPEPDLGGIEAIVRSGPGAFDVWESSPWRFETDALKDAPHTEEIVDIVFPGDPYLCAGWASWRFATRRRNTWRGQLSEMSLIVPNPMVGPSGLTKEGRESQHSLEATARRIYQVIEFDFAPLSRTGQPTIYAPLLEGWKTAGISTLDACAALSAHLARLLPSWLLFLSSGGKSGHAWFNVRGLPVPTRRAFFSEAVRLGGDPQLWTRSQLCRIPDGRRENGRRQTCFYFNPENCVAL